MTKGLSSTPLQLLRQHPPGPCSCSLAQGTSMSQGSQHTSKTLLQSQLHVDLTNQFGNLLVINPMYQFLSLFLNVIKILISILLLFPKQRKGQIRGRQGRCQAVAQGMSPAYQSNTPSLNIASLCDFRWVISNLVFQEGCVTPLPPESKRVRRIQSSINLSGSQFIQPENCWGRETGWN